MHGNIFSNPDNSTDASDIKLTSVEIWGYGFLFVTIINLSSVLGIIFFPLMKKSFYAIIMRCMIGLAIGSLSGSAIFHLIPQAFELSHDVHKDYIFVASFIWLAIWIVMILESTIKIIVKTQAANRQKLKVGLVQSMSMTDKNIENGDVGKVNGVGNNHVTEPLNPFLEDDTTGEEKTTTINGNNSVMEIYHSTFSLNRQAFNKMKGNLTDGDEDKCIKTVAWIVIIGDSLHNFIDGVSIGAGFTQSFSTGLILSLAVICEEFPHELGDFAILISSGLSVKKAIMFNFLSALTCYLGLALGILLGKIEFENLIFAFAAGIFLYVSLADMIPEVTSVIDEVCDIAPKQAWLVLINHNVGILIGILILYVLASYAP